MTDREPAPGVGDHVEQPAPSVPLPGTDDALDRPAGAWHRLAGNWGGGRPLSPRERARSAAIGRGLIAGAILIVIGSVVSLPLLILSPGPTYNTIGEVDGTALISISGTRTYPTAGQLDMTTISERGGSSEGVYLGETLIAWASPTRSVFPREALYDVDTTGEEVSEQNTQLFALSQSDAVAAALGELDIATEEAVVVTVVAGGSPADGVLEAGDVVQAVDGQEVSTPADVATFVQQRDVGDPVEMTVLRRSDPEEDPTELTLEITTAANPDPEDPEAAPTAYVGIVVGIEHRAPFTIDFGDSDVGGPSAGMMFSLGIIDILTPGPLNGGAHVAGTGTIDPEGNVGPIGGIQHKLEGAQRAGAELFIAPLRNCDDVVGNVPDGLRVAAVSTITDARAVVQRWADDPATSLPSCDEAVAAGPAGG